MGFDGLALDLQGFGTTVTPHPAAARMVNV